MVLGADMTEIALAAIETFELVSLFDAVRLMMIPPDEDNDDDDAAVENDCKRKRLMIDFYLLLIMKPFVIVLY